MAIITSSSTKATVCRSARRQRKAKHPGQRLDPSIIPSATPNRQVPKRRKVRNQDSQDLEGYYYASDYQGCHHDPEGQYGCEVTHKGNHDWLLEADITDPTVNTDETFPLLEHPELASECSDTRPGLAARTDTVVVKEKKGRQSLQLDLSTGLPTTVLPSLPTTPGATPRVKLPHGNPPSSVDRLLPAYSPGYLNDIGIPSPFLYHNLDNGYVPPSNNAAPCWGIPYFEYAYGQARPPPDFTSYRPVAAASLPPPALVDRRESLGFALGPAASSRHRAEESRISDESHDSSTHGCPLPCLPDASDRFDPATSSQCNPSNKFINENSPDVHHADPEWSWAGDVLRPRHGYHQEAEQSYVFPSGEDNLIYPTLPTPAYIRDAQAANYSLNNVVHPWANQAASYWDLAGPSVRTPTDRYDHVFLPSEAPSAFNYGVPLATGRTLAVPDHRGDRDVSVCVDIGMLAETASPNGMDLAPARLYQHQFIAWPTPQPVSAPLFQDRTPPDFDSVPDDSENVLKLFDWLVALNTAFPCSGENQSASDSPSEKLTEEVVYRYCEDLATPESEPCGSHNAMRCEALNYARPGEEYATTSHHDSEIELLSESKTDDEWAYWDWGTDSEDGSKPGPGIGIGPI